jgi:tetratricopeptide (TPR) repeat protein
MKTTRIGIALLGVLALGLAAGCGPKRKVVTERDRKEAAFLVSEAQFAATLRDWARAEGLLAKAVLVAPEGDYWLTLGAVRVRLENRGGAKEAYQAALGAFEDDAARDSTLAGPWIRQAFVLAILGRLDDSRALLAKAAKRFPQDTQVRSLMEPKQFEQMVTAPSFKEMAL